eukprot:COSAG05_NODE_1698_length_4256_cov_26.898737_4_plen_78_part_00
MHKVSAATPACLSSLSLSLSLFSEIGYQFAQRSKALGLKLRLLRCQHAWGACAHTHIRPLLRHAKHMIIFSLVNSRV